MQLGICASGGDLALLAGSGADYAEENVQSFLAPFKPAADFEARLKALSPQAPPLRSANCFLPGDLKCVGPQVDLERLLLYGGNAFVRARQAGIRTIVFGSAGSRSLPPGFERARAVEQLLGLLKKFGPMAAEQGVSLALEPLNTGECNFINSLNEGAEVVRAAGHPNVRLLCDLFHMRKEGEGPEAIVENGDLLAHAHVAELEGRAFPGRHGDDLGPYWRALKQVGYQGSLSLECEWTSLKDQAAGSLAGLRAELAEAGF